MEWERSLTDNTGSEVLEYWNRQTLPQPQSGCDSCHGSVAMDLSFGFATPPNAPKRKVNLDPYLMVNNSQ